MFQKLFKRLFTVVIATTLLSCAVQSSQLVAGPVILIVGDSVGAGLKGIPRNRNWYGIVETELLDLSPSTRIVNESVRGRVTSEGLTHLPSLLAEHKPDLVMLELGGNDALRNYPIETIRTNLLKMVLLIQNSGADVVLTGIEIPPRHGADYSVAFNTMYKEIAESKKLPLIPSFVAGIAEHPHLLLNDGLHPNGKAQPLLAEHALSVIKPWVRSFVTEPAE